MLTVVAYHYVRNLKNSKYEKIKGLAIQEFSNQIDYLKKKYNIISANDILDFYNEGINIPNNSALLTFDDGYLDHYENVLPLLKKNNLKGCFYIPASPAKNQIVLDVNKIQFLLSMNNNLDLLINEIKDEIIILKKNNELKNFEEYYDIYAKPNRWDDPKTIFIKRFLQKGLNYKLRKELTHKLFNKYVSENEEDFSKSLYMNQSQIKDLINEGHHIGCHGDQHLWWNDIPIKLINTEIDNSINFLKELGVNIDSWSACYPYGGVNNTCLELLKNKNCGFALTTQFGVADLIKDNKLLLPRYDTNDLPKS